MGGPAAVRTVCAIVGGQAAYPCHIATKESDIRGTQVDRPLLAYSLRGHYLQKECRVPLWRGTGAEGLCTWIVDGRQFDSCEERTRKLATGCSSSIGPVHTSCLPFSLVLGLAFVVFCTSSASAPAFKVLWFATFAGRLALRTAEFAAAFVASYGVGAAFWAAKAEEKFFDSSVWAALNAGDPRRRHAAT